MFVKVDKVDLKKIKFDKDGLIPMVIQDADSGAALSLFYGNLDSIKKMIETNYVWRYSRKNKKVMQKGEESGNTQKVVSILPDCDSDALLVKVKPTGPACHLGNASCFGDENSGFENPIDELVKVIAERNKTPDKNSYTSKVVQNRELAVEKLREELNELIEAKTKENIAFEAADLTYFMLIYLQNQKVDWSDVLKELKERRKRPSRYSSYGSNHIIDEMPKFK